MRERERRKKNNPVFSIFRTGFIPMEIESLVSFFLVSASLEDWKYKVCELQNTN
jgi:hypothetical protein